MSNKIYYDYNYEVMSSLLFGLRFLFYRPGDGDYLKLLKKEIDDKTRSQQVEYVSLLMNLGNLKTLENSIFSLTRFYRNHRFLVTEATLFSLNEFVSSNTLIPASGEWANSSDGFVHLLAYLLTAYAKQGKYLLDQKETFETIERITAFTHANMRVTISHTILFAIMAKILEYRNQNNGRGLTKKQLANSVDQGIRKVLYHYRDYQYLSELRYFVRLDKQLYDHATTMLPSSQIVKINPQELRANHYVVDTIETLIYYLLTAKSYESGIQSLVSIPSFHPYNAYLFTVLYSLAHRPSPIITKTFSFENLRNENLLRPHLSFDYVRAFKPIRAIVGLIVNDEDIKTDQIVHFVHQLEFEYTRLGFDFKVPIVRLFLTPKTSHEAYYELYFLLKTSKHFDQTFLKNLTHIYSLIKM